MEPYVRMGQVPHGVLYEPNDYTPHEAAPLELHFPQVQGVYIPQHVLGQARMSNGLRVCHFASTTLTREIIFGDEHAALTHPENPEDTRSPQYHLLDDFPPYFVLTQNRANTLECARTRRRSSKPSEPVVSWADRSDRLRRPV